MANEAILTPTQLSGRIELLEQELRRAQSQITRAEQRAALVEKSARESGSWDTVDGSIVRTGKG
jgi:hypothetical protein